MGDAPLLSVLDAERSFHTPFFAVRSDTSQVDFKQPVKVIGNIGALDRFDLFGRVVCFLRACLHFWRPYVKAPLCQIQGCHSAP